MLMGQILALEDVNISFFLSFYIYILPIYLSIYLHIHIHTYIHQSPLQVDGVAMYLLSH